MKPEAGSVIHAWVDFAHGARFESIPASIADKAKRHILDTLGAALAGATSTEAIAAARLHTRFGQGGPCQIWGRDFRLSPTAAAFANGVASHAFELDDTGGCDHSGAVVVPAVLAALEVADKPVSGGEFIRAVVLGYEFARRVLEACGGYQPHNQAGWHSTGTCGTFGAAIAAAIVLDLEPVQIASALGLAGSASAGTWAFIHDAAHSKRFHAGRAAEGGVAAALLAQDGIRGPAKLLDDVWGGFLNTYVASKADREALLVDMGGKWRLERVSIKPYASCRGTHSGVDSVGIIMDRNAISADGIKEIRLRCSTFLNEMCGGRDLSTLASSQMSLPLAVALRAVFGDANLTAYQGSNRHSAEVAAMLARVTMVPDPSLPHSENPFVEIDDTSGQTHAYRETDPKGSPTNALSERQLMGKFTGLSLRSVSEQRSSEIARFVDTIDEVADARQLPMLLRGEPDAFRPFM